MILFSYLSVSFTLIWPYDGLLLIFDAHYHVGIYFPFVQLIEDKLIEKLVFFFIIYKSCECSHRQHCLLTMSL